MALGAAAGASIVAFGQLAIRRLKPMDLAAATALAAKRKLPNRVILLRHGESEGNSDATLYRTKADNLIELTPKGID